MPHASTSSDEKWMRRAIELAWRGAGGTRPNPPVGCVVAHRSRRVGEGYHRRAGGPHAEVLALRQAGARARDATAYVTLEPCSTWGRTGPCTAAILKNGIRRVVIACRDPNPRHAGRGVRRLRARGIEVLEGVCAEEGNRLIRPFARWIVTGRPFVTLKMAMTLDGRIADARGESRWITGARARARVKSLRNRVDAVMVGSGTVRADDPSLLPASVRRKPWRVILDSAGRTPAGAKLLTDSFADRTLVITTSRCPARKVRRYERNGSTVVRVGADRRGRVGLGNVLRVLGGMGVLHVLCEGGGEMAAGLIRDGLADELLFFVAPKVLGGRAAAPVVWGTGWTLAKAPELRFLGCERVGDDILLRAEPR